MTIQKDSSTNITVRFRPIKETVEDLEFLYSVYASTRAEEMSMTGWSEQEIDQFLRMQFGLQHTQYMKNYQNGGTFDIILVDNVPAGRLYVYRKPDDIRIVDIALLPQFQRKGIGSMLMKDLITEADSKNLSLSLHVEQNNPALGLYENLGFQTKDLIGVYFFMVRPPKSV
ncbi:MAG: GNAT family N-acetyltransferase [Candidatus Omnitrophota bacterium]